jgi:hypothetical protein
VLDLDDHRRQGHQHEQASTAPTTEVSRLSPRFSSVVTSRSDDVGCGRSVGSGGVC